LHQTLKLAKKSVDSGNMKEAKEKTIEMSNALKEMVSGISEQNKSLSSTKSMGDDDEAEEEDKKDDAADDEEKPKKKKGKGKKKGIETCDDPLQKIEEIEG